MISAMYNFTWLTLIALWQLALQKLACAKPSFWLWNQVCIDLTWMAQIVKWSPAHSGPYLQVKHLCRNQHPHCSEAPWAMTPRHLALRRESLGDAEVLRRWRCVEVCSLYVHSWGETFRFNLRWLIEGRPENLSHTCSPVLETRFWFFFSPLFALMSTPHLQAWNICMPGIVYSLESQST